MKPSVAEHIANIVPYPPGKPIEELEREYGISGSIKLASNENPLGPSPKAVEAIVAATSKLNRYPDGSGFYLRKRLAEKHRLPFDSILLGNGSNEIIELVIRAFMSPGDEVMMPEPSFLLYKLVVQWMGGRAAPIPLKEDWGIDLDKMAEAVTAKTKVIFLTNPNNPTGKVISKTDFEAFLSRVPQSAAVVLDEAYIEFNTNPDTPLGFDYISGQSPAVIVLRTFSKAYGLAGLRIGFGAMDPEIAGFLNRVRQPFNTGSLAQAAALAALDDDEFLSRSRQTTWSGLQFLYKEIEKMGLRHIPSEANFFLIEVPCEAKELYEAMLRRGVIIRSMASYGMKRFIRVNVGLPEENIRFIGALKEVLAEMARVDSSRGDKTISDGAQNR
ncbi:MAG: histidinol-phosphate transaminase [Deltaproteobacteria bacterium]|jgi:histidinol-phosphate aminotransferase|nr:histidinol-phosphate transaminase [Deltaproteobacteria bacterium]